MKESDNSDKRLTKVLCLGILFSLLILPYSSLCQSGYIAKDTTVVFGVRILKSIPKDNARQITVISKSETITYYPGDIDEFGINNENSFKSLAINVNGETEYYFFERIYQGRFNLYYLPEGFGDSNFYISVDSDSTLTGIPKTDYKGFLLQYVDDCASSFTNIQSLKYSRKSFIRFIESYKECSGRPVIRTRYGYYVGSAFTKLGSIGDLNKFNNAKFKYNFDIVFGITGEFPIKTSDFSVVAELIFHHVKSTTEYLTYGFVVNELHEFDVNQLRLNIPFLLRYTIKAGPKISPGLELGPYYSLLLRGKSEVSTWYLDGQRTFKGVNDDIGLNKQMLGITAGAGFNLNFKSGSGMAVRIKYFKGFPFESHDFLSMNILSLSVGVIAK